MNLEPIKRNGKPLALLDDVEFQVGVIVDPTKPPEEQEPFYMTLGMMIVHLVCLGESGSGKTNFLELLHRFMLWLGAAFCLIDPHGDMAKRLMAFIHWLHKNGLTSIVKRCHFLEITPERAFALDAGASLPGRSEVKPLVYYQLLKACADRVISCMLRRVPEAEQAVMLRMKRFLKSIVTACLVDYMGNNTHVGLHKALVFTNPDHEEFPGLIEKVYPFLPDEARTDFDQLMSIKRPQDRDKLIESTVNRLRDIISSPLIKLVCSQQKPSINFREIIRKGDFVIVSIPQSLYVSQDEKLTVIGLIMNEVFVAKEVEEGQLPEAQRVPFTMTCDEIGEAIGEDWRRALGACRKWKLRLAAGAQNISKLCIGDIEAAGETMAESKLKIIMQQQEFLNLEKAAKDSAQGNIDHTERVEERIVQRGWIEIKREEHSFGVQESEGDGHGGSASQTDVKGKAISKGTANATNWSDAQAQGSAQADVNTASNAQGLVLAPDGTPKSKTVNAADSAAHSSSRTNNSTQTQGGSSSSTESKTLSESTAIQNGTNWMKNVTKGMSHTVAYKTMLIANLVPEWKPSGKLDKGPIDVQWSRILSVIAGLNVGEALVKIPERPDAFKVKFAYAAPVYFGAAHDWAVNECIRMVTHQKPYIFVPVDVVDQGLPNAAELPRIEKADEPTIVDPEESEKKTDDNPMF